MDDLTPPTDDTGRPARTGGLLGLLRRWGGRSAGVNASFAMVEELFGPTRHQARIEIEQQKGLAQPAPAPGDPPEREGTGRPLPGDDNRRGPASTGLPDC